MSAGPSCHRCRRPLEPGQLKFSVRITITADFDGHLAAGEGEAQAALAKALAEAEALTEEELMAGVHQELGLLVCGPCRATLLRELLSAGFLRESGGMVQ